MPAKLDDGLIQGDSVAGILDSGLGAGMGLPSLTPTWFSRSFVHPGRHIKLNSSDLCACGADRGGIDDTALLPMPAPAGAFVA